MTGSVLAATRFKLSKQVKIGSVNKNTTIVLILSVQCANLCMHEDQQNVQYTTDHTAWNTVSHNAIHLCIYIDTHIYTFIYTHTYPYDMWQECSTVLYETLFHSTEFYFTYSSDSLGRSRFMWIVSGILSGCSVEFSDGSLLDITELIRFRPSGADW